MYNEYEKTLVRVGMLRAYIEFAKYFDDIRAGYIRDDNIDAAEGAWACRKAMIDFNIDEYMQKNF